MTVRAGAPRPLPFTEPASSPAEAPDDPTMDALLIEGGVKLEGRVPISGAKNAALPVMTATLLAPGVHTLRNVPLLADTRTMGRVLEKLGATVRFVGDICTIDTSKVTSVEAPYDLVRTMRASIYVLGPLLARFGAARVSLPGGCAWGPRPVNLHIEGLRALGADLQIDHGYIVGKDERLKGGTISFEKVSVGATGNLLMAATLADGVTTLDNVALEPDITALARILVRCGAHIEGIGTRRLVIHGVKELKPIDTAIIPDRIEAATYMAAAAITGGTLTLEHCEAEHVGAAVQTLQEAGCTVLSADREVAITGPRRPQPVDVATAPFPGFPTDMQAQIMAVLSMASGVSRITDTVYLDRFSHVPELARLGANIRLEGNIATVRGVEKLQGAPVMAPDIRASAALVIAALAAEGETRISRIYHLDRGYERLDQKLAQVGARIQRTRE
jgi:UDP-N-acetylglucosamine 1-carboxyvinyltransferase